MQLAASAVNVPQKTAHLAAKAFAIAVVMVALAVFSSVRLPATLSVGPVKVRVAETPVGQFQRLISSFFGNTAVYADEYEEQAWWFPNEDAEMQQADDGTWYQEGTTYYPNGYSETQTRAVPSPEEGGGYDGTNYGPYPDEYEYSYVGGGGYQPEPSYSSDPATSPYDCWCDYMDYSP